MTSYPLVIDKYLPLGEYPDLPENFNGYEKFIFMIMFIIIIIILFKIKTFNKF
jgi:hypothetical protein